ncbi:TrmO family methyltransferase domain-containing protein [Nocardia veterana]|uniref:TrmO family methyltransferase domain-containing protein n=1 Tax=Nocardia veterana TaxID=132249 RepID=UPI0035710225
MRSGPPSSRNSAPTHCSESRSSRISRWSTFFDRVDDSDIHPGARHPRGNPEWPRVGIFAQRGKARPDRIGVRGVPAGCCRRTGRYRPALDAIDGTPVLDIKPYLSEFAPRGAVRQPAWSHELMAGYRR